MKERPILFSAPMVNAILDGRKTQTRRIVKPPSWALDGEWGIGKTGDGIDWLQCADPSGSPVFAPCPYGEPGDRLWVREAWRTGCKLDKYTPKQIGALAAEAGYQEAAPVKYLADSGLRSWGDNDLADFGDWGRYRHARFMPRWASRITLEVTAVRVERLQEISEHDAVVEGLLMLNEDDANLWFTGNSTVERWSDGWFLDPREAFSGLWESINGDGSWDANPWVWVVEFQRVTSSTHR